jgi:hypothetical protein
MKYIDDAIPKFDVMRSVFLASKPERVLTQDAENDRAAFEAAGYRMGGCTCFISPPCGYCTHPGNPLNQEEDNSCWEIRKVRR